MARAASTPSFSMQAMHKSFKMGWLKGLVLGSERQADRCASSIRRILSVWLFEERTNWAKLANIVASVGLSRLFCTSVFKKIEPLQLNSRNSAVTHVVMSSVEK